MDRNAPDGVESRREITTLVEHHEEGDEQQDHHRNCHHHVAGDVAASGRTIEIGNRANPHTHHVGHHDGHDHPSEQGGYMERGVSFGREVIVEEHVEEQTDGNQFAQIDAKLQ